MSEETNETTKSVNVGGKPFDIPAVQNEARSVGIWRQDSETLETFVKSFVANNTRLAFLITHELCKTKGYYLVSYKDWNDKHHVRKTCPE